MNDIDHMEHVRVVRKDGLNIQKIERVGGVRYCMHEVYFERGCVERRLNSNKNGEHSRRDGMNGEIYKASGT